MERRSRSCWRLRKHDDLQVIASYQVPRCFAAAFAAALPVRTSAFGQEWNSPIRDCQPNLRELASVRLALTLKSAVPRRVDYEVLNHSLKL